MEPSNTADSDSSIRQVGGGALYMEGEFIASDLRELHYEEPELAQIVMKNLHRKEANE